MDKPERGNVLPQWDLWEHLTTAISSIRGASLSKDILEHDEFRRVIELPAGARKVIIEAFKATHLVELGDCVGQNTLQDKTASRTSQSKLNAWSDRMPAAITSNFNLFCLSPKTHHHLRMNEKRAKYILQNSTVLLHV